MSCLWGGFFPSLQTQWFAPWVMVVCSYVSSRCLKGTGAVCPSVWLLHCTFNGEFPFQSSKEELSFHPQLPWYYNYVFWKHFKNCFWRSTCISVCEIGRDGMALYWMEPLMALKEDSDQQKASRWKKNQVPLSCCRALCWNQQVLKKRR